MGDAIVILLQFIVVTLAMNVHTEIIKKSQFLGKIMVKASFHLLEVIKQLFRVEVL